ncbi:MAG: DUF2125 domain-containing protein [Pseudomonadota bacterium]
MRFLLGLITIAAALWSGYWFIGQNGVTAGFAAWFEDRRAEGWAAEYSALETQGFPNRFDTQFTDLVLADPDTGLAWEAPFFKLLALSYKPNHVIAVFANDQLFATPQDKFQVQSEEMRASVVLGADVALPLERSTLTAQSLTVTPASTGEPATADALRLGVERLATGQPSYRFGLAADGLSPALDWRVQLDPAGRLPDAFDALNADFTVTFDKDWDRTAIEDARPQPRRIDIKLVEARWGRLELLVAGEVNVDAAGLPDGEVVVKARNWRDILQMAVTSGTMNETFADTLEGGLSLISQMAGNPETLDIPLNFSGGRVRIGPVPLGPAPVLRLR